MHVFSRGGGTLARALVLLVALALALPAAAAACGEEGGEDTAPLIPWATATPATLPSSGGTITVTAKVEDDCGVQQVYGAIESSEGGNYAFEMLPYEDIDSNARIYRAEFAAPANYREWAVYYAVNISAEDTNGGYNFVYAGETEVEAAPQFDEAPYVTNATLTPQNLPHTGGRVTIGADISDTRGVSYAFAIVTTPSEKQIEVPLEPVSWLHYEGHFKAPSNPGTGHPTYSVRVYGQDDIGQETSESAGTFTVSPKTGWLRLRYLEKKRFGNVAVGDFRARTIEIHNFGGVLTKPVKATLATSGAPFWLQGGTTQEFTFTIAPQETKAFNVRFAPTEPGFAEGTVTLSRADEVEPPVSLAFLGTGISPE
jgi:hypothetical protein